jgi:hypothetical protein
LKLKTKTWGLLAMTSGKSEDAIEAYGEWHLVVPEIYVRGELLETHPESPPSHGKNVPISLSALPTKTGAVARSQIGSWSRKIYKNCP